MNHRSLAVALQAGILDRTSRSQTRVTMTPKHGAPAAVPARVPAPKPATPIAPVLENKIMSQNNTAIAAPTMAEVLARLEAAEARAAAAEARVSSAAAPAIGPIDAPVFEGEVSRQQVGDAVLVTVLDGFYDRAKSAQVDLVKVCRVTGKPGKFALAKPIVNRTPATLLNQNTMALNKVATDMAIEAATIHFGTVTPEAE